VAAADPTPLGRVCVPQNGVRFCAGSVANRVPSFDGVPLDVDVTVPPTGDGPFPTIVMMHGWGGDKTDFETIGPNGEKSGGTTSTQQYHWNNVYFAQHGYAVVNYTARGFGDSCGSVTSRAAPGCLQGWVHLADQRYEARDTQFLLGQLVDGGITQPGAIGVTGISYGGGQSIELSFLRNRIRKLPSEGSGLVPWTSPNGTPLSITAAYPRWPWSDLDNSLEPNGRFVDFPNRTPSLRDSRDPLGVQKQSYNQGLFALGATSGFYSPPLADPNADLTTWNARVNAGEPEDAQGRAIADEIFNYHQGFGLSGTPAPLLIENGWTDDLFPPQEALRIYNWVRSGNPGAAVSLQFGDLGHSRGSNKTNVDQAFNDQAAGFFDRYLKGSGAAPAPGAVTTYTQTCPKSAPGGGPFSASNWVGIHPGAVRWSSAAEQSVSSTGGNASTGTSIDPIANSDACKQVDEERASGTAVYVGPASQGYTLLGLPTVQADVATSDQFGQLDSRLWDVGPDGKQTLISRGVYRLLDNQKGTIVFQLHGNGWRFERGHKPKLELLGRDAPYARASNGSFTVRVSNLTIELPLLEHIGRPILGLGLRAPKTSNRIRLVVRPRRVKAGQRRRFRFRAWIVEGGKRVRVRGARIRIGGKRVRTGRSGRAAKRVRFRRPGRRRVIATKKGLRRGVARVRVRRARR
jgi:fermentation-respiration switch protein FrsA (DUF1100 family)